MDIVRVKRRKEILFLPHTFPHEVKGQSFEYFISGEGYKKTKAFEILNEEIPERWSRLSWLEIMYIYEKYGRYCSLIYAETKCAGYVALENLLSRYSLFQKAKHLLCRKTDAAFFELIKTDGILSWLGMYQIDITTMDDELGKRDSEYQPELALYQGKPCSMDGYIRQKFGERYVRLMNAMMN